MSPPERRISLVAHACRKLTKQRRYPECSEFQPVIATPQLSDCRVPEPGATVHVRQRLYLVEQVQPPPNPGDATLVSLSCVDDDAQGQRSEEHTSELQS